MDSKDIKKYINKLPEIYQPIYNFEELSGKTSRNCIDRLEEIIKVYDALKEKEKRDLNIEGKSTF